MPILVSFRATPLTILLPYFHERFLFPPRKSHFLPVSLFNREKCIANCTTSSSGTTTAAQWIIWKPVMNEWRDQARRQSLLNEKLIFSLHRHTRRKLNKAVFVSFTVWVQFNVVCILSPFSVERMDGLSGFSECKTSLSWSLNRLYKGRFIEPERSKKSF